MTSPFASLPEYRVVADDDTGARVTVVENSASQAVERLHEMAREYGSACIETSTGPVCRALLSRFDAARGEK